MFGWMISMYIIYITLRIIHQALFTTAFEWLLYWGESHVHGANLMWREPSQHGCSGARLSIDIPDCLHHLSARTPLWHHSTSACVLVWVRYRRVNPCWDKESPSVNTRSPLPALWALGLAAPGMRGVGYRRDVKGNLNRGIQPQI